MSNESQQFENKGKIKEAIIKGKWALHFIEIYYNKSKNHKFLTSKIESKKKLNSLFQFKGIGTERDPFIITSSDVKDEVFVIRESKYFVKILNGIIDTLFLIGCENVTINSSNFNYLDVYRSSNISIDSSKISQLIIEKFSNSSIISSKIKFLGLSDSSNLLIRDNEIKDKLGLRIVHDIVLKNNKITLLSMKYCYDNEILDCRIKNIEVKFSKANLLQDNDLNYKSLENINSRYSFWESNKSSLKNSIAVLCSIPIIAGFITFIVRKSFPDEATFLTLLPIFLILTILSFIGLSIWEYLTYPKDKNFRKINKLPDNKVVKSNII
ncbi:MAG: hypothetical protein ACFFC3_09545 [Candidatus Odinarchaeota archaeon]